MSTLGISSQQRSVSDIYNVTQFICVPEAKHSVYEYMCNSNNRYSKICHGGKIIVGSGCEENNKYRNRPLAKCCTRVSTR